MTSAICLVFSGFIKMLTKLSYAFYTKRANDGACDDVCNKWAGDDCCATQCRLRARRRSKAHFVAQKKSIDYVKITNGAGWMAMDINFIKVLLDRLVSEWKKCARVEKGLQRRLVRRHSSRRDKKGKNVRAKCGNVTCRHYRSGGKKKIACADE